MTHADDLVPVEIIGRKRTPGFLLAPFGWAAEPLTAMVQAEPSLLADLFGISRPRMHLIALALAHLDPQETPEIGPLLVRGSVRQVLDRVLAQRPAGFKRVLSHLPGAVLQRENYLRLVGLLEDPEAAKVLHHADKIDDAAVRVLADLPQPLRLPLTAAVPGWSDKLDGLADGLRFLVSRGVAPSFDEVVADLSVTQYGQLAAKFGDWVDGLPLPESMPPPIVGPARRLDRSGDVCALGKRWKNCLADYVPAIDAGECAVYFWENTEMPAVCLVRRHGRLGWFLDETKGPRNADLEPGPLEIVAATFADIGIQTSRAISGIENLIFCRAWQTPR
jgi:hypothetical protein